LNFFLQIKEKKGRSEMRKRKPEREIAFYILPVGVCKANLQSFFIE
jgi:hypothetical protein